MVAPRGDTGDFRFPAGVAYGEAAVTRRARVARRASMSSLDLCPSGDLIPESPGIGRHR